jgi:hypothetical protein
VAGHNAGGIYYSASPVFPLEIINTTIVGNTADANQLGSGKGGGIYGASFQENVYLRNSILFGNIDTGGETPDCAGVVVSEDYNFVGDPSGCSLIGNLFNSFIGVDPLLASLADNGGPTQTMALPPNSPAINTGSCLDLDGQFVLFDQRGFPRPPVNCDVGAFELTLGVQSVLPLIMR